MNVMSHIIYVINVILSLCNFSCLYNLSRCENDNTSIDYKKTQLKLLSYYNFPHPKSKKLSFSIE